MTVQCVGELESTHTSINFLSLSKQESIFKAQRNDRI